jgi:hypothetical protein
MKLWEKGFINIDFLQDDPTATLTKKAFNKEEVSKLPQDMQWGLEEIKRLLKKRNF